MVVVKSELEEDSDDSRCEEFQHFTNPRGSQGQLPSSTFSYDSYSSRLVIPAIALLHHRQSEFDGFMSWEAYRVRFELVAEAKGWSREERAPHLVVA